MHDEAVAVHDVVDFLVVVLVVVVVLILVQIVQLNSDVSHTTPFSLRQKSLFPIMRSLVIHHVLKGK